MTDVAVFVAVFYITAAPVYGASCAFAKDPVMEFAGKPLRHPRIFAFVVCGLFWPFLLFRMIIRRS